MKRYSIAKAFASNIPTFFDFQTKVTEGCDQPAENSYLTIYLIILVQDMYM